MNRLVWGALLLLFSGSLLRGADRQRVDHAETCGRCQRDILLAWKKSAHAHAMENPLFQDALERAQDLAGGPVRSTCLECHAPSVRYSGDLALRAKVTWEGVTCDFCHSVKAVHFTERNPSYEVAFDGVKTGPLGEVSSPAHGTAFSEVHTSSLVCAGCHEYRNSTGFLVFGTYSEWAQSRYGREGIHCQQCHMGERAGNVVDPKIKRVTRGTINLHEMPGSRSVSQLNQAIQIRLNTEREGEELIVRVRIRNRGAGHMVPTGSALRRLNLEVRVGVNGKSLLQQRSYSRTVVDKAGKELEREEEVIIMGARTVSDTRLRPDEEREEVFRFPVPPAKAARVKATLSYHYSPQLEDPDATSVNFIVLPQYVPPGS